MQSARTKKTLLALAMASVLSGCGGGGSGSNDYSKNSRGVTEGCPDELVCHYFSAPKDYDNPQLGTADIFYGVHKARKPSERLGILVFNFGGPGSGAVSGTAYMVREWLPAAILDKFDVVGMDPRGSGKSAFAGELTQCALAGDCSQVNRELGHYMGSNSVVNDLDKLRETLGEDKLNFLGYSYGTRLGSLYAATFPQNVRAIVLDSPMPPGSGNYIDLRVGNTRGYDVVADFRLQTQERKQQLERVAESIYTNGRYTSFGGSLDEAKGRVLLNKLSSRDPSEQFIGIRSDLYDFLDFGAISSLLNKLSYSGSGSMSDDDRRHSALFKSVVCTDESSPVEQNEVDNSLYQYKQASAIYGQMNFSDTARMCVGWPGERDPIAPVENMEQVLTGQQILIIGGQYDPATPYVWAEQMKQSFGSLASMTTVTNRVDHGFSYTGLGCVDDQTTAYLLNPEQSLPEVSCDGTYTSPHAAFRAMISGKEHPAKTVQGF